MKILVCITHVPDTTSKIAFKDSNKTFDSNGVQYIIGPYDEYALSKAIDLKEQLGGTVTVINVGEADTEPTIRKALAIGADDAIRVNAHPSDALFVADQIVAACKNNTYDLILMGKESIDYNGGMVHAMVSAKLGIPLVTPIMKLEINNNTATMLKEVEGGKESITCELPLVAGCQEPIAEWKIPNMRGIMSARTKPLQVIEPVTSNSNASNLSYELPATKGACKMILAENAGELISLLRNEAKVI
jgi:electron transfer flavoprotein beta subunit